MVRSFRATPFESLVRWFDRFLFVIYVVTFDPCLKVTQPHS